MGLRECANEWKYSDLLKGLENSEKKIFLNFLSRFEHDAISVYKWGNIPDYIKERDIEFLLYTKRQTTIKKDEYGLFHVLESWNNKYNMYGFPIEITIRYPDGTSEIRNSDDPDIVTIYDTSVYDSGRIDFISVWAEKYASVQTTIDEQIINQRTPFVISGATPKEIDKSVKAVQYLVNGVKIMAVDSGTIDNIKIWDLNPPYNVESLIQAQQEYLKRASESIGIDSLESFGKKERMIKDEVESNDERLSLVLQDSLNSRRRGIIELKQKFGIDWTVDVLTPVRIVSETDTGDGVDNERTQ